MLVHTCARACGRYIQGQLECNCTGLIMNGLINIYQCAYVYHGILEYAMVLTISEFFLFNFISIFRARI